MLGSNDRPTGTRQAGWSSCGERGLAHGWRRSCSQPVPTLNDLGPYAGGPSQPLSGENAYGPVFWKVETVECNLTAGGYSYRRDSMGSRLAALIAG